MFTYLTYRTRTYERGRSHHGVGGSQFPEDSYPLLKFLWLAKSLVEGNAMANPSAESQKESCNKTVACDFGGSLPELGLKSRFGGNR